MKSAPVELGFDALYVEHLSQRASVRGPVWLSTREFDKTIDRRVRGFLGIGSVLTPYLKAARYTVKADQLKMDT